MISMNQDRVKLDIRGKRPRPYSTKGEGPWRNFVASHVRDARIKGGIPELFTLATEGDRFEIWLVFHLVEVRQPPDLDNLSKSVLDTLFCDRSSNKYVKGALFQIDDCHVWKLHLEKKVVSNEKEEGVSIVIDFYTP